PVLGIVENMSIHVCERCGHEEHIFGEHGGRDLSEQYGVPLLGQLPLDRRIREETDEGEPTVAADPSGPLALAFREAALRAVGELAARSKDYSRLFPKITREDDCSSGVYLRSSAASRRAGPCICRRDHGKTSRRLRRIRGTASARRLRSRKSLRAAASCSRTRASPGPPSRAPEALRSR